MKINFTPGPSQLYFTVENHMRQAFREGIPSLSHRSREFEGISRKATEGLRTLLNLPANFHIFFTGSATEIWERSLQNLVENKSVHFVNGAFSKRYFEIATQLKKSATKVEVPAGQGFEGDLAIADTELIALTHNETSTGVSLPLSFIHQFREMQPEALIVVDAVSSVPYPQFDFSKIDSVFFSVQKGFGLPAGLGVWIVNDRCIAKSEALLRKGISIGTYHNLPTLLSHAKKNQTPETPNVLGIYLLAQVTEDLLRRGIVAIRKETEYKAAILYQALQSHPHLQPAVTHNQFRSQTVVVVQSGNHTESLTRYLNQQGMQPGDGYGEWKAVQLRFANFPTHSKETYEKLADLITDFKG